MADITLEDDLQEMVSYRRNVTGVAHTVFISPKGHARHGPRISQLVPAEHGLLGAHSVIKVAIVPPDSLDPRSETASLGFDGQIAGNIDPELLHQLQQFITLNRRVLLDYWEYRIDTDELRRRLRSIEG